MQYKCGIAFIILAFVSVPTLSSWSEDGFIREEQIFSDKPIAQFGKALLVGEIVLSPNGKILAVPEEGGICFYDADNLTEVAILPIDGRVSLIVFSPDGKTLALGIGGRICLWDTTWKEGITTLGFHDRNIDSIVFSSDGKTLTSACYGEVRSWDIAGKKEIGVLKGIPPGNLQMLSPDGKILAVSGSETIRIWDIGVGKEISVLKGHTGWQITTAFSSDGKTFASGSEDQRDKTVRLWDIKEGKAIAVIEGDRVYGFSPDGKTLYLHYISDEEEGVRLWDVTEGKEIDTWRFYRQSPKLFSMDWKRLILRDWDGTIRLWDVTEKKEIASLEKYYAGSIYSIDFSPDGRMLASGEGKIIRLWDVAEQKEIAVFEGRADVTFSPDGKMLVLNCRFDKTVRLWDIAEKKETIAFKGSFSFAPHFSPDGKILAVEEGYDPSTTRLWDIEKKKEIGTIKGGHTVYNSDGRLIAPCDDKVVRLWDVVEQKEIADFEGHTNKATYVIFSPDGKTLASIDDDGTARLWNVADKKEIAVFEGEISKLCFSPDGKILAVGSHIKVGVVEKGSDFEGESFYTPVVRLWDIEGRKEVAVFKQDIKDLVAEVDEIAFAPDGKTVFLIIHFFEGMVSLILWDIEEKEETVIYDGEELLYYLSPDNRIIALLENGGLQLWDIMEKRAVQFIDLESYHDAPPVFSPDWKKFAAPHNGIIAIWGEKSSQ